MKVLYSPGKGKRWLSGKGERGNLMLAYQRVRIAPSSLQRLEGKIREVLKGARGRSLNHAITELNPILRSRDRYPLRTQQAHACKGKRQSRTLDQACQPPRSAVSQRVNGIEDTKARIHAAGQGWICAQPRFQGSRFKDEGLILPTGRFAAGLVFALFPVSTLGPVFASMVAALSVVQARPFQALPVRRRALGRRQMAYCTSHLPGERA
ncbi:MAG: hypothetical protein Q8N89_06095 [Azonexus sp.]|nr:hypothetical protein [Azonexus sp.]